MGSDRRSEKPDTGEVDEAWGEGEEAPSTRAVDSVELFRRAALMRESSASMPVPVDQRATVPPPLPPSEYVAHMMMQAPESDGHAPFKPPGARPTLAERHRAILQTLHEEDPLRFDFEDGRSQSGAPAAAGPTLASELAPTIETSMSTTSDLPPDLLRETPVPEFDELDALPVDEVLASVSLRPVDVQKQRVELDLEPQRETPVPGAISDIPASAPPASGGDPWANVHSRATMPGFDSEDPIGKVHERFIVGDYSGALVLADELLVEHPSHLEAQRYAESCREMLRQMYVSRLGGGDQIPHVIMAPDQLRWLTLDHRAGFLLSCIDGTSTVDDILDVCGMQSLDAQRILYELLQEGVIQMEPPASSKRIRE